MSISERGATWLWSVGSLKASPVTLKLAVSTTMAVARKRVPKDAGRSGSGDLNRSRARANAPVSGEVASERGWRTGNFTR